MINLQKSTQFEIVIVPGTSVEEAMELVKNHWEIENTANRFWKGEIDPDYFFDFLESRGINMDLYGINLGDYFDS